MSASDVGPLGVGEYDLYIYDRRGEYRLARIASFVVLSWERLRDDISQASVTTYGGGDDDGVLDNLACWLHTFVVVRNGDRVWEGPITRLAYEGDGRITIAAHDVMVVPYRRIAREGYNDSYPNSRSVVARARMLLESTFALDDPNLGAHVRAFEYPDDAKQSRVVPPYSRTVFEEIDDMASNAGLDYTALGRSIVLWDTHQPLARLPRMTQTDFLSSPVITEYGMSAATFSAVTNGSGLYGAAGNSGVDPILGLLETLASTYSEAESEVDPFAGVNEAQSALDNAQADLDRANATNAYVAQMWALFASLPACTTETGPVPCAWNNRLTTSDGYRTYLIDGSGTRVDIDRLPTQATIDASIAAAATALAAAQSAYVEAKAESDLLVAQLQASMASQAERNIAGRNPAPMVVRIPDGATLNPRANLGINQLVPGAWIPLYATAGRRTVEQWQKLDSVKVSVSSAGEQVGLTMSPAPGQGQDTDAEMAAAEDAG